MKCLLYARLCVRCQGYKSNKTDLCSSTVGRESERHMHLFQIVISSPNKRTDFVIVDNRRFYLLVRQDF